MTSFKRVLVMMGMGLLLAAPRAIASREIRGELVAYTNASWWNGERFVRGERWTRGDRFVAKTAQAADRVVDLRGDFVLPLFGDAHQHAIDPYNTTQMLRSGVAYLKNPDTIATVAGPLRAALGKPDTVDMVIAMGGLTGPGGHPIPLWTEELGPKVFPTISKQDFEGNAFHVVSTKDDVVRAIEQLVSQHADFVKVFLVFSEQFQRRKDDPRFIGRRGVDPALVPVIVAEAHRRGLKVAAHVTTAADFRNAIAAGVDEIAHLPGASAGEPPVSQYLIDPKDAARAAAAHIVVVTTAALADAVPRTADARAQVRAMQFSNLALLRKAGVRVVLGSDVVAPNAILVETYYLSALKAFDNRELLRLLATDTPRYIFPKRAIGSLSPGSEASFAYLRADPLADLHALAAVEGVVKQGVPLPGQRRKE